MTDVIITSGEIRAGGRTVVQIDRVDIGGGSQIVTVDGTPEERIHPESFKYHVRMISPDRMIPDQLRETDDWDEAVKLAQAYAKKLAAHQAQADKLAADLQVE